MHLKEITIHKFRMLQNITIRFQIPQAGGNVVNVIAGENGCGKTSLLEAIFQLYNSPKTFYKEGKASLTGLVEDKGFFPLQHEKEQLEANPASSNFQVVYLTTTHGLLYQATTQLNKTYQFVRSINNRDILGNAELYIKEFILAHERRSTLPDPKARTQEAVDAFNQNFQHANMLTQLVDLDGNNYNRPVFRNIANELVTIDKLSDGEKQLYGRVVALLMLEPQNSLILIDEPDIALHPSWQQKIMQIYSQIGKNNQFIIATHSPQIIAHTPYNNLILLTKQAQKIDPVYPSHPPSGVDVNSILSEIMGVPKTIPQDVAELQSRYRDFVMKELENSDEALQIKAKLLERESNDSKFMQEMRFLIRLRGRK